MAMPAGIAMRAMSADGYMGRPLPRVGRTPVARGPASRVGADVTVGLPKNVGKTNTGEVVSAMVSRRSR